MSTHNRDTNMLLATTLAMFWEASPKRMCDTIMSYFYKYVDPSNGKVEQSDNLAIDQQDHTETSALVLALRRREPISIRPQLKSCHPLAERRRA